MRRTRQGRKPKTPWNAAFRTQPTSIIKVVLTNLILTTSAIWRMRDPDDGADDIESGVRLVT